jgi:glycosyltransferase involved in cell wall biosynthesis
MNSDNKPKISACLIVYNHEKYIADAIEGALIQKLDCDYEIVISEDCSTDNTRAIVEEYQKKHPDKIKLYLNEKNLGLMGNWRASLERCQGEYIAILEGDDFWTNPNKLQKQVDFLDNNPGFSLIVHNTDIVDQNKNFIRTQCPKNHPDIITTEKMFEGKSFATCSIVFRSSILNKLPNWFWNLEAADWTLPVFCAVNGKVKYFSEIMASYRKQNQGAAYNQKLIAENEGHDFFRFVEDEVFKKCDSLNKHFNFKYDKPLRKTKLYWYNNLVDKYYYANDKKNAKKNARILLKEIVLLFYWRSSWLTPKRFIKLLLISLNLL